MFSPPVATAGRRSMLETMFFHLDCGLSALKSNTLEKLPFTAISRFSHSTKPFHSFIEAQAPKVFISKWIDYSNKYGLGYQLTNGHTGVYFNDSTTVIMSADGMLVPDSFISCLNLLDISNTSNTQRARTRL